MPSAGQEQARERTIRVALSAEVLLGHLLHLDGALMGAEVERHGDAAMLVLHVDYPGAPEAADTLQPDYTRIACQGQAACPGQVSLTGLQWRSGDVPVV